MSIHKETDAEYAQRLYLSWVVSGGMERITAARDEMQRRMDRIEWDFHVEKTVREIICDKWGTRTWMKDVPRG